MESLLGEDPGRLRGVQRGRTHTAPAGLPTCPGSRSVALGGLCVVSARELLSLGLLESFPVSSPSFLLLKFRQARQRSVPQTPARPTALLLGDSRVLALVPASPLHQHYVFLGEKDSRLSQKVMSS